jgi:hypothetical protein
VARATSYRWHQIVTRGWDHGLAPQRLCPRSYQNAVCYPFGGRHVSSSRRYAEVVVDDSRLRHPTPSCWDVTFVGTEIRHERSPTKCDVHCERRMERSLQRANQIGNTSFCQGAARCGPSPSVTLLSGYQQVACIRRLSTSSAPWPR